MLIQESNAPIRKSKFLYIEGYKQLNGKFLKDNVLHLQGDIPHMRSRSILIETMFMFSRERKLHPRWSENKRQSSTGVQGSKVFVTDLNFCVGKATSSSIEFIVENNVFHLRGRIPYM